MSNPGNTGHRYKMPQVVGAEKTAEGHILILLSCGHTYTMTMEKSDNVDRWLNWAEARVQQGKRQRCDQCK